MEYNLKNITVYCDGACSGNPGPGGWGAILMYKNAKKEISGFDPDTTNNRMELTACIRALEALNERCNVSIYTDSAYVFNAYDKKWIESWKKSGWRKADKKPVENVDLWQALDDLTKRHLVRFIKVKGHSDNQYNNRADKLATDEIKQYKKKQSTQ